MATKRPKKATRAELELKQLITAEAPADLRQIQAVIGKVQRRGLSQALRESGWETLVVLPFSDNYPRVLLLACKSH